MAANTIPIYTKLGQIGFSSITLTTANTAKDGTGTTALLFTAGADGARVELVKKNLEIRCLLLKKTLLRTLSILKF